MRFALHAVAFAACALCAAAAPAAGPLRVHPANPRYFTDGATGRDGAPNAILLTGSHTWNNFADMWREGTPRAAFDFDTYLRFLEQHGHNFIRLWAWDGMTYDTRANGAFGKNFVHTVAPLPWARTGPGQAVDGAAKFDLAKLDPAYFERLRSRVDAAGRRGIYVSVMLFEGWGLAHGSRNRAPAPDGWAWRGHPFHPDNNLNGLDVPLTAAGLGKVHSLASPAVNALQAAYIRRVVEAVNGCDNVLFEVINEGGEPGWDWWVVQQIRSAEQAMPRQHPIGITGHGGETLASMLASPADWISPGSRDGFRDDPPAWSGQKVSLLDTDHVWGIGGSAAWVWKSFLRGHNPIFMDPYDGSVLAATAQEPRWESVRRAMGAVRRMAGRVNLAALTPQPKLASTDYCLAAPGVEYLVYQPKPGEEFTVELPVGAYEGEWFDPQQGRTEPASVTIARAGPRRFRANFDGVAVLHLRRTAG